MPKLFAVLPSPPVMEATAFLKREGDMTAARGDFFGLLARLAGGVFLGGVVHLEVLDSVERVRGMVLDGCG